MPKRATAAVTVLLFASVLTLAASSTAAAQSGRARWPPGMDQCDGAAAVVVASDTKAQSDIDSAVTLVGVLGTRCLVDAGARTAPMPAASAALLDSANENIYVVGGTAAVPDSKLHGRRVHRVGGADRWATARLAGGVAQHIAQGNRPPFQTVKAPFSAVSGSGYSGCGLRTDGSLACWHNGNPDLTAVSETSAVEVPVTSGKFSAVSGNAHDGCGLHTDGSLTCWSDGTGNSSAAFDVYGIANRVRHLELPVSGKFSAVSGGGPSGCGLRTDGSLACWEMNTNEGYWGELTAVELPVSGKFTAVSGGGPFGCGLRANGSLACWHGWGTPVVATEPPVSGKFTSVSDESWGGGGCGLRADGRLACWVWIKGDTKPRAMKLPVSGKFTAVSGNGGAGCGLRTDGSLACWYFPYDRPVATEPPVSGKFTAVSGNGPFGCGLRTDGRLACWSSDYDDGTGELHEFVAVVPPV